MRKLLLIIFLNLNFVYITEMIAGQKKEVSTSFWGKAKETAKKTFSTELSKPKKEAEDMLKKLKENLKLLDKSPSSEKYNQSKRQFESILALKSSDKDIEEIYKKTRQQAIDLVNKSDGYSKQKRLSLAEQNKEQDKRNEAKAAEKKIQKQQEKEAQELKEKKAREQKEKAERDRKEQEERKQKEKEERERKEKAERDRKEREEREKKEKEEREKKEKEEREKKEKEERERKEKESARVAAERAERKNKLQADFDRLQATRSRTTDVVKKQLEVADQLGYYTSGWNEEQGLADDVERLKKELYALEHPRPSVVRTVQDIEKEIQKTDQLIRSQEADLASPQRSGLDESQTRDSLEILRKQRDELVREKAQKSP